MDKANRKRLAALSGAIASLTMSIPAQAGAAPVPAAEVPSVSPSYYLRAR